MLLFFFAAHTHAHRHAGGVVCARALIAFRTNCTIQYTQNDTLLASKSRLKIAPKRLASSFSSHRIEAYNHKTFLFRTHAHALSRLCGSRTHTHAPHTVRSARSTRQRIKFIGPKRLILRARVRAKICSIFSFDFLLSSEKYAIFISCIAINVSDGGNGVRWRRIRCPSAC